MSGDIAIRVEIERSGADRLIIKNDRSTPLTLVGLREPARQARVTAVSSAYVPGEFPLAVTLQQSMLGFDVAARDAATEAAAQESIDELSNAVLPLEVLIHVIYGDSFERTWLCHGGSVVPAGERDYVDLRDHDPVWATNVPCHPIPVAP